MLRIYPVLLELVRSLRPLVRQLERSDPDLVRQCRRALASEARCGLRLAPEPAGSPTAGQPGARANGTRSDEARTRRERTARSTGDRTGPRSRCRPTVAICIAAATIPTAVQAILTAASRDAEAATFPLPAKQKALAFAGHAVATGVHRVHSPTIRAAGLISVVLGAVVHVIRMGIPERETPVVAAGRPRVDPACPS